MLYLASAFAPWLVLSALGGVVVGRMTPANGSWSRGWFPIGVGIFAALLVMCLFRWLPGASAFWVETLLLFIAAYTIGCFIGAAIRPRSIVTANMPIAETVRTTEPVSITEPAASPPLPDEGEHEGKRPAGLITPREGAPDNLKLIKGVGRQNELRLQQLGIWHFVQIAAWSDEEIRWVGSYLAFRGRIEREDWRGQAKMLSTGGKTEFARRAASGKVPSSKS